MAERCRGRNASNTARPEQHHARSDDGELTGCDRAENRVNTYYTTLSNQLLSSSQHTMFVAASETDLIG